jgi:hypothetical protein
MPTSGKTAPGKSSPVFPLVSKLNLMLELRSILNAIVAGQATHYLVALPVVEDPGYVLARNACHGGEIVLPNPLTDDDTARPDFLSEMVRQLENRPGDPAFEPKEGPGCNHRVCLA